MPADAQAGILQLIEPLAKLWNCHPEGSEGAVFEADASLRSAWQPYENDILQETHL